MSLASIHAAAVLVAADRNAGLDDDEQMSVYDGVMEARNVLRLPEHVAYPGAVALEEDDADTNPTTRAYRVILEAAEWEIVEALSVPTDIPANVVQMDVVRSVRDAYPTPLLADAIKALDAACVEHGLDGYEGEAVSYLTALLRMAEDPTLSAEDAVKRAYGVGSKAGA